MASGTVIGECLPRHRAAGFLTFLKKIGRTTPAHLELHLIAGNYATHKTPAVNRWFKRHARFHIHFTPASSSWLNPVERRFAEITRQRIRRGTFTSLPELKAAIEDWIEHRNNTPSHSPGPKAQEKSPPATAAPETNSLPWPTDVHE